MFNRLILNPQQTMAIFGPPEPEITTVTIGGATSGPTWEVVGEQVPGGYVVKVITRGQRPLYRVDEQFAISDFGSFKVKAVTGPMNRHARRAQHKTGKRK